MLDLLNNKIAQFEQQLVDMNNISQEMTNKGMSKDLKERNAFIEWIKEHAVETQRKTQNIMTELRPYQYKFNSLKYRYIQYNGEIEYNEFIKRNNLSWGLGIYW